MHIINIIFCLIHFLDATPIINQCMAGSTTQLALLRRKKKELLLKLWLWRNMQTMVQMSFSSLDLKFRSRWTKTRTQSFWEIDCQQNGEAFFKENFRMDRRSFNICGIVKNLQKSDTNMRKAIPLEKRVAIALYTLGSSAEYRSIANMFGIGKSTVGQILIDFCHEAWKCLWPLHLNNFPLTEEKVEEYVKGFEALGFPQCMGAIDGCHIEIHPSSKDATDYFNYKGWYSTVLLALVDGRCRFIYINVGAPGRCNDSFIFENSQLKQQLTDCRLLKDMSKIICNVNVPVLIIGDSAFRFSNALIKPYPFSVAQSPEQKLFNYTLSRSRRVVENAFGHLKARFRRIGKGIDNKMNNATIIIKACTALHNYLNERNDHVNDKWISALQEVEKLRQYPDETAVIYDHNTAAEEIRKALSSYFCKKNLWRFLPSKNVVF